MTTITDIPGDVKMFDLNSNSSVYVVSRTLSEAIEHYTKDLGISGDEAIFEPTEVPRSEWDRFTFVDGDSSTDGVTRPFSEQVLLELNRGETMPFLLATEEW